MSNQGLILQVIIPLTHIFVLQELCCLTNLPTGNLLLRTSYISHILHVCDVLIPKENIQAIFTVYQQRMQKLTIQGTNLHLSYKNDVKKNPNFSIHRNGMNQRHSLGQENIEHQQRMQGHWKKLRPWYFSLAQEMTCIMILSDKIYSVYKGSILYLSLIWVTFLILSES